MELPHLGQHCSEVTCRQLDFLPMKCDACGEIFCKDHILYAQHHCKASYKKDVQVPVCPLCNQPVPVNRNELPDIKVGQHMDQDCQSTTAKDKRKKSNKCSASSCRKKELISIKCDHCKLNFCLKHRHPIDHNCQRASSSNSPSIANAGAAAIARSKSNQNNSKSNTKSENSSNQYSNNFVTSMSEDEALARALQLSLMDEPNAPLNPHGEDLQLAQAIAASEQQYSKEKRNTSSCNVS